MCMWRCAVIRVPTPLPHARPPPRAQFTVLSAKIGPRRVVNLLDRLYYAFDEIVKATGCYKVETIGDGVRAAPRRDIVI